MLFLIEKDKIEIVINKDSNLKSKLINLFTAIKDLLSDVYIEGLNVNLNLINFDDWITAIENIWQLEEGIYDGTNFVLEITDKTIKLKLGNSVL